MRNREGYHRGRDGWQPSERQRQVLDLLVEGKSNAEIAAALGITADGAKWHVGELLAKTEVEDRHALAAWWAEERDSRQAAYLPLWLRLSPAALVISTAAVVLILVTGWLLWGREDGGNEALVLPEAAAPDVAPSPTPAPPQWFAAGPPPPCDTPMPDGFRAVTADELRTEGLVEFGPVIQPQTCPMQVSNREGLALFWLADGGEIDPREMGLHGIGRWGTGDVWTSAGYGPGNLGFYYEGEEFRVGMSFSDTLDPEGYLEDPVDSVIQDRDHIRLYRVESEGAFARIMLAGETSGQHRVALASDGTLFFDPEPLPGSLTTNHITGETLDVSGMTLLGRLEFTAFGGYPAEAWNRCPVMTGVCNVELPYPLETLKLPTAGVLSSAPVPSAQEKFLDVPREKILGYEFDMGEYVLRFTSPNGSYNRVWDGSCPRPEDPAGHEGCSRGPLTVDAGHDLHAWTLVSVDAFSSDGRQVSLVITRDGDLYIGDLTLKLGCPCRNAR